MNIHGHCDSQASPSIEERAQPGKPSDSVSEGMARHRIPDPIALAKGDEAARLLELDHDVNASAIKRKCWQKIVWLFCIVAVLCYLDRTNLSYAALTLTADLGLAPSQYGFGSGIFFLGYTLFQVPSNVVLSIVGARRWLSFLVVCWGSTALMFAFVKTKWQFYVLRIVLGAFEAGTMPGIWLATDKFFNESEMTMVWGYILIAIMISQIIGGPIAAGLLACDGVLGLRGWQILFLGEGIPTIALGAFLLAEVADSPLEARFLSPAERAWLHAQRAWDRAHPVGGISHAGALEGMSHARTWHLAAVQALANVPKFGIIFWCPLLINSFLHSGSQAAAVLLSALPFTVAAVAIKVNSSHSRLTGERRWHVAGPLLLSAAALGVLAATINRNALVSFVALVLAAVAWAPDGILASWPATFLTGPAAATGVAIVNSCGGIGGFAGPYMIGALEEASGGYQVPVLVLAACAALVAGLAVLMPDSRRPQHAITRDCSGRAASTEETFEPAVM